MILAPPLRAQQAGAVANFTGEMTGRWQRDHFVFEITPEQFTLNEKGKVDLAVVMSAAAKSTLNPGPISIIRHGDPRQANRALPQRKNSPGSLSSFSLVSLKPGIYEIITSPQNLTKGAYEVSVYLAGDVNGDRRVDDEDRGLILDLINTKYGAKGYNLAADVNRNGIINKQDLKRAGMNAGAAAADTEAEESFLPEGALAFVDLPADKTCDVEAPVKIGLTGADFDAANATDFSITVNGVPVPAASLLVEKNLITASGILQDGENAISMEGYDTLGRPLYLEGTFWAGGATLIVTLENPDGTPFLQEAKVTLALGDDENVGAELITSTGSVSFAHVPARTVLVTAQGPGNETGSVGLIGDAGPAKISLKGFSAVSGVDNNDFSQGLDGWTIPDGTGVIISHQEIIPGFEPPVGIAPLAEVADQDLSLGTSGEGEKTAGRSFATKPGTTGVRARYRFITSEVPGGYFGSKYNDYFRVSIRSKKAGKQASYGNSMNSLGLAAFDYASGSTNWRDVVLAVDKGGDIIEVDAVVANVGDELYDSSVVIDFVEEISDKVIPHLAWNNQIGGIDLTYEVEEGSITEDVEIPVHWASFPGLDNRLGAAIHITTVSAGTGPGSYGPIHIAGYDLTDDPAGTNCIMAASSATNIASLADVKIPCTGNAKPAHVTAAMTNAQKDCLRIAGQSKATISSTVRSPADQARIMFGNLTNSKFTREQNVANQRATYKAPGEAVIDVFVAEATGKTDAEVIASATSIKAAMLEEIEAQGPSNVSHHCSTDPPSICVVDVPSGSFNSKNGPLYVAAAKPPRMSVFLDERKTNGCYHSELPFP